jgi:hypothetical protein
MVEDKANEDTLVVDDVGGDKKPSHPESVPWTQYVGLKEKFNKVEADLKGKVGGLEEQLKKAVTTEEHNRIKAELDAVKAEKTKLETDVKTAKEQTLSEKRATLVKRGVPEADLKDLSERELGIMEKALGIPTTKPKPDMGSGGGSGVPKGSPMELARQAYSKK